MGVRVGVGVVVLVGGCGGGCMVGGYDRCVTCVGCGNEGCCVTCEACR